MKARAVCCGSALLRLTFPPFPLAVSLPLQPTPLIADEAQRLATNQQTCSISQWTRPAAAQAVHKAAEKDRAGKVSHCQEHSPNEWLTLKRPTGTKPAPLP